MSTTLPDRSMGKCSSLHDTSRPFTDLARNSALNATHTTTGLRKPNLTALSKPSPSAKNGKTQAIAPSQLSKSPSKRSTTCSSTVSASTSKNGRPRAETCRLPKTSGTKSSRPSRANLNRRSSSSSASLSKGATGPSNHKLVSCSSNHFCKC
jgi:hypothetical protein